MKKQIWIGLSVLTLLAGCGVENNLPTSTNSTGVSSGQNTTALNAANLNTITLTTTAENVGTSATYFHVRQNIDNSALNNVLSVGTNYTGTLVTTCVRGTATTVYVPYVCTTSYAQTQVPFNVPDAVNNVRFNIGETYKVYQNESRLQGADVRTFVGSVTMQ